jgi:UDP-hydrolysing UDP-N-acetyl-D-glucosamine 2-epimerase
MIKKICVVTSTRADYGLLREPMKALKSSKDFELQTLVTGTHFSKFFGETYKEILSDGFHIDKKVSLPDFEDSPTSIAEQTAQTLSGSAKAFAELKPDAVVVLGDRYEILGVTQAAFFLKIPLIHLHGGELTQGALDDSIRHAITKLSNFHVTSTLEYKNRVLQLGEPEDKVFCLGATGLENFKSTPLKTKEELELDLNFKFYKKNLLITFHPVTASDESVQELITALERFKDVGQIITLPNSDTGHKEVRQLLVEYAQKRSNVIALPSLGQVRYNSVMKVVDVVVGNSSSGIVEAPFCGVQSLNVGNRQKGRVMDPLKITSVSCDSTQIENALHKILSKKQDNTSSKIYGKGDFSKKFINTLKKLELTSLKKFSDVELKINN